VFIYFSKTLFADEVLEYCVVKSVFDFTFELLYLGAVFVEFEKIRKTANLLLF
jgi:hypothetical protein